MLTFFVAPSDRCSYVLSRGSGGVGRPVMGHSVRAGSYQAMRVPVTVLEWRAGSDAARRNSPGLLVEIPHPGRGWTLGVASFGELA
jgi:hypothetical protein